MLEQQRGELDRAAAAIQARTHTVEQARRQHELTELALQQGVVNTLQLAGDAE